MKRKSETGPSEPYTLTLINSTGICHWGNVNLCCHGTKPQKCIKLIYMLGLLKPLHCVLTENIVNIMDHTTM
jgi:hypothetical protein